MATASGKSKSATEALLDKFTEMAMGRAKHMNEEEFQRAVKESKAIIRKSRASRAPHRGKR